MTVSGVKRCNWPPSRAPVTATGPLTDCNNSFVTLVTQRDKAYMTIAAAIFSDKETPADLLSVGEKEVMRTARV